MLRESFLLDRLDHTSWKALEEAGAAVHANEALPDGRVAWRVESFFVHEQEWNREGDILRVCVWDTPGATSITSAHRDPLTCTDHWTISLLLQDVQNQNLRHSHILNYFDVFHYILPYTLRPVPPMIMCRFRLAPHVSYSPTFLRCMAFQWAPRISSSAGRR